LLLAAIALVSVCSVEWNWWRGSLQCQCLWSGWSGCDPEGSQIGERRGTCI